MMRHALLLLTLLGALGTAQTSRSSTSGEIQVLPVRENLYMLQAAGSNIAVQVGKQGILLVDSGQAENSEKVLAALLKLTPARIRYIINTSVNSEHAGGNEDLRRAGIQIFGGPGAGALRDAQEGAAILAHENVLNRMSAPTGRKASAPPYGWPTDTYFGNQKEIYFNGEPIELIHISEAHSDGDSLVFFRRSDVVASGEIFTTTNFPVIDLQKSGSIEGVIEGLNRLLDILVPEHEEEGGTLVIPGRGRICDEADVVEYRDMVTIIRDRIQDVIHRGMTLAQIQGERPTRDYDPQYAVNPEWTPAMFVEAIYKNLTTGKSRKD